MHQLVTNTLPFSRDIFVYEYCNYFSCGYLPVSGLALVPGQSPNKAQYTHTHTHSLNSLLRHLSSPAKQNSFSCYLQIRAVTHCLQNRTSFYRYPTEQNSFMLPADQNSFLQILHRTEQRKLQFRGFFKAAVPALAVRGMQFCALCCALLRLSHVFLNFQNSKLRLDTGKPCLECLRTINGLCCKAMHTLMQPFAYSKYIFKERQWGVHSKCFSKSAHWTNPRPHR